MSEEIEQEHLLSGVPQDEVDAFFASPIWKYLDQEAAALAAAHLHNLSTLDNMVDIHRSQGALGVIRDKRATEEWIRNKVMELQERQQEETTEA